MPAGQEFFNQGTEMRVVTEQMGSIVGAVIEAIAAHRGVESTELVTPLHEVIDADALEAMYRTGSGSPTESYPTVRFTYEGDAIVVKGPNDIKVQSAPTPS